jgi:uncharacterized membrane protein YqiK
VDFGLIIKILSLILGLAGLAVVAPKFILGLVIIGESQVGIVIKKFSSKQLKEGKLIALNGEAGYQADTLGPGYHLGFFPWQYTVERRKMVEIQAGQIGLILASDGEPIPQNRILAAEVECNDYQDARTFLTKGGQKGRQLGVLTAGKYRINTALFQVVTQKNASEYGLNSDQLRVVSIIADQVGIVTTLDGTPINQGEIAGGLTEGHDNFQNPRAFMANGGKRGLQEQVLLSGTWNLNPWFVDVKLTNMTEVPIGAVGVVISYVGKEHKDISGDAFKHGDLVEKGHKGVWEEPLYPGKHALNARTTKVEVVPTTNIALNWATNRTEAHKLDEKLSSITVRSKDGFSFNLDVCQVIHISAKQASRVISRFGAMKNLVEQVLEPAIGNYFRNSAQEHSVLEFLSARSERQKQASEFISAALNGYDVEAVDTLIGDINPPEQLMQTQIERKLAEEMKKTFEVQELAQKQRQQLVREQSLADSQPGLVGAERSVMISDLDAKSKINQAKGESEAMSLRAKGEADMIRLRGEGEANSILKIGEAKASAYKAGVAAMGEGNYTMLQIMNVIGDQKVKLIPETLITGESGGQSLLLTGLLANMFKEQSKPKLTSAIETIQAEAAKAKEMLNKDRPKA